jgi:hypothetical protein
MAKKQIINPNKKQTNSPTGSRFHSLLITLLVIGFICSVCYIFYLQVTDKIHLPDDVLKVLATATAILVVRSYHIMIKARFNNDS